MDQESDEARESQVAHDMVVQCRRYMLFFMSPARTIKVMLIRRNKTYIDRYIYIL